MANRTKAKRLSWSDFHADDDSHEAGYVQSEDGDLQLFRCGNCGGWTAPSEGHKVDEWGDVTPSVVHDPCGWHVWLTLDGWKTKTKSG